MVISDVNLGGEVKDDYHFGHILLDCLKKRRPDDICQINAATGEEETFGSFLDRSIRLAKSLRNVGLQPGDVIIVGARSHLNLRIPFFSAVFNGLPVAGIDPFFKYAELKAMFQIAQPKAAFCDSDVFDLYTRVANDLGMNVKIISMDDDEHSMTKFVEENYEDNAEEFKPASFDTEKIYCWLISTSGTTGVPKLAAVTHQRVVETLKQVLKLGMIGTLVEGKQKTGLNVSPPQWFSYYMNSFGFPLTNTCLVQSTKADLEHIIDIINKYKPTVVLSSPSLYARVLKSDIYCDLTCFDTITVGGAKIYTEILTGLKARIRPGAKIIEGYGQTEAVGMLLAMDLSKNEPLGSLSEDVMGVGVHKFKLVDPATGEEIKEPHKNGELIFKGPSLAEYYNDPTETKNIFTEDGWIKTGDMFYKDEKSYYYFVERIKMLIKYRNIHVIPPELEEVILTHPDVLEVGVTSVPSLEDGQHPVACVARRPGAKVTAQEIKNLITENLSDSKQLRGGVVFLDELPKTSTGKVNRVLLREIALTANRE